MNIISHENLNIEKEQMLLGDTNAIIVYSSKFVEAKLISYSSFLGFENTVIKNSECSFFANFIEVQNSIIQSTKLTLQFEIMLVENSIIYMSENIFFTEGKLIFRNCEIYYDNPLPTFQDTVITFVNCKVFRKKSMNISSNILLLDTEIVEY